MALGITWSLPDEDRHSQTKNELLATIKRLVAGRIAEEIQFGDVTTGASNDFEKATELARRMVTQYGMSDELGPIQYGRGNHQVFLGRDLGEDRNYSEEIAGKIDAEVRRIIDSCNAEARKILDDNWDKVERMANSLLEHETVETEEVLAILADKPWPPKPEGVTGEQKPPLAATPTEPEPRSERPKRLPPTISPEPA
jgi:cell division protease FtsH